VGSNCNFISTWDGEIKCLGGSRQYPFSLQGRSLEIPSVSRFPNANIFKGKHGGELRGRERVRIHSWEVCGCIP